MTLNPYVRPLTTSVCQATFWFSNDIRKCVLFFFFQRVGGSELRALAGGGGGQSGDTGKKEKKEGTGWGTVKGALLQCSSCFTTQSSCVDHRRCVGWMTNKFRKSSQVGAARDEVSVNLQPQTITGLMSTDVDPLLVETSPGVCLGFSW